MSSLRDRIRSAWRRFLDDRRIVEARRVAKILLRWLKWSTIGFDYHADPIYLAESEWVDSYAIESRQEDENPVVEKFAWEAFATANEARDQVMTRLADILTASTALAVLLLTAVQGFHLPATALVMFSFACFLTAAIVVILARRASWVLTLPRIRYIATSLPQVAAQNRVRWTAMTVYSAALSVQSSTRFLARQLNVTSWLMILGIVGLVPSIFGSADSPNAAQERRPAEVEGKSAAVPAVLNPSSTAAP